MLCTKRGPENYSAASQLTQLSRPTTTNYLCQSKFPKISNKNFLTKNQHFPSYVFFMNHSEMWSFFKFFKLDAPFNYHSCNSICSQDLLAQHRLCITTRTNYKKDHTQANTLKLDEHHIFYLLKRGWKLYTEYVINEPRSSVKLQFGFLENTLRIFRKLL